MTHWTKPLRAALCFMLALLMILSTALGSAAASSGTRKVTKADKTAMAESVNQFGWNLYKKAAGKDNYFCSPLSMEAALAMCDVAASGTTKKQLEKTLCISDLQSFELAMKWLRGKYASPKDKAAGQLTVANSVWMDKSLQTAKNYQKDVETPLKTYFGAEVKRVDFRNNTKGVKQQISRWVRTNTGGMIRNYQPICDASTKANLINAVYFYGEWASKFEPQNTSKRKFYGTKGTKSVDQMAMGSTSFRVLSQTSGVRGIALPYRDGKFEMDLFIGSRAKDISAAMKKTDLPQLLKKLDKAGSVSVRTLQVPKFTMDVTFKDLKKQLQALGMKVPFTADANFNKLSPELCISDINHRAKVEVDEEGSRAAAVTEVSMKATAVMDPSTVDFIVDRPFFFVIRETSTGMILFTGHVNNL